MLSGNVIIITIGIVADAKVGRRLLGHHRARSSTSRLGFYLAGGCDFGHNNYKRLKPSAASCTLECTIGVGVGGQEGDLGCQPPLFDRVWFPQWSGGHLNLFVFAAPEVKANNSRVNDVARYSSTKSTALSGIKWSF